MILKFIQQHVRWQTKYMRCQFLNTNTEIDGIKKLILIHFES